LQLDYNARMRAYVSRFFTTDFAANIARLHAAVDEAAQLACELAMFPEQFLTGYYGAGDPLRIKAELAAASTRHPHLLCICGTITEDGMNRQYAYLGGEPRACYTKVHLFEPNGEHQLWGRGERYVALSWGGWRIGMLTCNDVRFPEQARALKLKHDVNLLVYPALWPWSRDHVFAALLRARAIENNAFAIGCCVMGVDNGVEQFDGAGNHVFDPLGNELHPAGRTYELDHGELAQVTVDTRAQYREITQVELIKLD
jgi:predicted amidohydrolase